MIEEVLELQLIILLFYLCVCEREGREETETYMLVSKEGLGSSGTYR